MKNKKWLNLQLFAGEGGAGSGAAPGGEGGGEAASGENASVAAEQRLRELGVPEDKIRRRAKKQSAAPVATPIEEKPTVTAEADEEVAAPTEDNPTEEKAEAPARMSWEEIMADPEYNKQMQGIIRARLKTAGVAEENLAKLAPAIEVLAKKYKLDPTKVDYDALNKAINDDDEYYEDEALELGVSTETAKKLDQQKRDNAREKASIDRARQEQEEAMKRTLQEQKFQNHLAKLEREGESLKKTFPSFDLKKELQNPIFARMTSPSGGISVEDAYYAVHRKEIQTAAMQVTAQKTAQKLSNAIASGSKRPNEAGTQSQAPSVTSFNYRNASRQEREAFKQNLRSAWARGEKVYPGQK